MSYEEMFEKAQCCGVISVRSSNSKSGRFQKKWVSILNYTSNGSHYFWAVLVKNAPGDFPAKNYFLQEIRPDTEFKQDRKHNIKEFTFTSSKTSLSFMLETAEEQKTWMEGPGFNKKWEADIFMLLSSRYSHLRGCVLTHRYKNNEFQEFW